MVARSCHGKTWEWPLIQVHGGNLWFAIQWFIEKKGIPRGNQEWWIPRTRDFNFETTSKFMADILCAFFLFLSRVCQPLIYPFVGKSHMLLQNKANKSFGNIVLLRNIEMLFWECMWHVDNIITVVSDYPYSTPIFIKHPQVVVACKPLAMPRMHIFSCPGPLLSSPLMRWWPGVSAYSGSSGARGKFGAFDREKVLIVHSTKTVSNGQTLYVNNVLYPHPCPCVNLVLMYVVSQGREESCTLSCEPNGTQKWR